MHVAHAHHKYIIIGFPDGFSRNNFLEMKKKHFRFHYQVKCNKKVENTHSYTDQTLIQELFGERKGE